jgi:hypothetical protein
VTGTPALIANLGAEENGRAGALPAAALVMARLWSLLFPAGAGFLDPGPGESQWPASLGPVPSTPAFPWLPQDGAVAWLVTVDAERSAREAGHALFGPPPDVVRRVHDKAFAHRLCRRAGLEPASLRDLVGVLDPVELEDTEAALRSLQQRLDGWPAWTRGRFALKPRHGSSGRGRVPGSAGAADTPAVRNALPRLARSGGALLEPWLERERDLSVQLHVAPAGGLDLIATLEQRVSPAGVYRGHRGWIDYRGRIVSGSDRDDALLEAACEVARAAAAEGFHGPCGVDAFVFRGPRGSELRPVVEFNARFTTGTVLAGLIRRALPRIRKRAGLAPGQRLAFAFALEAPAEGWPNEDDAQRIVLPLWQECDPLRPALVIAADPELLGV